MRRLTFFLFVFCLSAQQVSEHLWTTLTTTGTTSGFAVPANDIHTLAVVVTGSPSGCQVNLDGSLDSSFWFDISGAQTCTSSTAFHVVNRAVMFVRANLTTLSGGTAPTVSPKYVGHSSGGK